jgi:hypothetical protein
LFRFKARRNASDLRVNGGVTYARAWAANRSCI